MTSRRQGFADRLQTILPGLEVAGADDHAFIGVSEAARRIEQQVVELAPLDIPVTICGETGTGKGVVAALVHHYSRRGPFVELVGGEIPPSLAQAELFGCVRGAYTGAEEREGALRRADRGTLFLDEIQHLPKGALLGLRAFLDGRGAPVLGASNRVDPDVRVIVGTPLPLGELMRQRRIPPDVVYRLYGVELYLPPLRERREDIVVLATRFLSRLAERHGTESRGLSAEVGAALESRFWEGNVRELQRAIEVAFFRAGGNTIQPRHLPAPLSAGLQTPPAKRRRLDRLEATLAEASGNVAEAARQLGCDPSTIRRRASRQGISLTHLRGVADTPA